MKPTKENKGGIISKESFIHQSNVKNLEIKKEVKKIGKKMTPRLKTTYDKEIIAKLNEQT